MQKERKQAPLYKIAEQKLRNMLADPEYAGGKPLPPENELAPALGVSRVTLRRAMDQLLEERLIVRVPGKGTFVRQAETGGNAAGSTRLVGVLLPTLTSPHAVQLLQGIEHALSERGYHAALGFSEHSQATETRVLDEFRSLGVCGVLLYPSQHEKYNESILRLALQRFPIVMVDRYLKGIGTSAACSDNFGGAYGATSCLLELGHRKIGFLTSPPDGSTSLEDRLEGYEHALAESGIPIDKRLRLVLPVGPGDVDEENVADFLHANPDVTAVVAAEPNLGTAALLAAERCGIRVPENLSVVSFDECACPGIGAQGSFVRQDGVRLGRAAAEQLLKLIDNPATEAEKIVIPVELVKGVTTAPPN